VAAGCLFTFVVASRGHVCDCIAFLLIYGKIVLTDYESMCHSVSVGLNWK